jgi:hypothetical protein
MLYKSLVVIDKKPFLLFLFMVQKPILNQNTWKTLDRNNAYFQLIENCKTKIYDPGVNLQIHHIIPQYVLKETAEGQAYLNLPENIIILSEDDHIKAHQLLYEIYGNKQDQGAILLLKGSMNESRTIWKQLGAEKTHLIQKQNGTTIYSIDWQKEMAARSMARPDALEIRSKGGKVGGRTRNLDRVIKQNDRYIFSLEGTGTRGTKCEVLCIINCRTGGDVLEQLNFYKQTPLQRVTPLLNASRKSLHGWSCKKVE